MIIKVSQQKKSWKIKAGLIPYSQEITATNPTSFVIRVTTGKNLILSFDTGSGGWMRSFSWLFSTMHSV